MTNLFDFIAGYSSPRLLRQNIEEIGSSGVMPPIDCSKILRYLGRYDEYDVLNKFRQLRYSMGTRSVPKTDTVSGEALEQLGIGPNFASGLVYDDDYHYVKPGSASAIAHGMYEQITTGLGTNLVQARANMFTAPDQYWETIREGEIEKSEATEQTATAIESIRSSGGFKRRMCTVDFAAVALGRCYLHIGMLGWRIDYDVVTPGSITFVYGDTITEYRPGGTDNDFTIRATNKNSIDDASAVIITVATGETNTYLAYVGRYETNDDGRCVLYKSSSPWPIPKIGDDGKNGVVIKEHPRGNPMTWLRTQPEKSVAKTEYPIIEINGNLTDIGNVRGRLVSPIYNNALEVDDLVSSLMTYAKDGARGFYALIRGETPGPLPKNLRQPVLSNGDQIQEYGRGADQSLAAMNFLKGVITQLAGSYHVPAWMVLKDMILPESGASIIAQMAPYNRARQDRIDDNSEQVEAIFDVERARLVETHGAALMKPLLEVDQKWHPGTIEAPLSGMDKINELNAAEDGGLIDLVEKMRRYHMDPTPEHTMRRIDTYRERVEYGGYEQEREEEDAIGKALFDQPSG